MKVQTSPFERAVNLLARGDAKSCDLADELEKATRAWMARDLAHARELMAVARAVHAYAFEDDFGPMNEADEVELKAIVAAVRK